MRTIHQNSRSLPAAVVVRELVDVDRRFAELEKAELAGDRTLGLLLDALYERRRELNILLATTVPNSMSEALAMVAAAIEFVERPHTHPAFDPDDNDSSDFDCLAALLAAAHRFMVQAQTAGGVSTTV